LDETREFAFEAFDLVTENERGRFHHIVEGRVDFLSDRVVLRDEIDEGNYLECPFARAGTPTTVSPGATSLVTTAPAPMRARAPTRTPPMITAPEPSAAPRSTTVGRRV